MVHSQKVSYTSCLSSVFSPRSCICCVYFFIPVEVSLCRTVLNIENSEKPWCWCWKPKAVIWTVNEVWVLKSVWAKCFPRAYILLMASITRYLLWLLHQGTSKPSYKICGSCFPPCHILQLQILHRQLPDKPCVSGCREELGYP